LQPGSNFKLTNMHFDTGCEDFSVRKDDVGQADPECSVIALEGWKVAKALRDFTLDIHLDAFGANLKE